MKVQIRKGVFETNSSSTHALVLQKGLNNKTVTDMLWDLPKELRVYIQSNGIEFGKKSNYWDWCYDESVDDSIKAFGEKLDQLWETVLCMNTKYIFRFMNYCSYIKRNYYINYSINTSEEYLDSHDPSMCLVDDSDIQLIASHVIDSQENFEKYIFSNSYLDEFDNNIDPADKFNNKNIDVYCINE